MKQIFIAWTSYIRRPDSMKEYFGYSLNYLPPIFHKKILKPLNYLISGAKTVSILLKNKPDVVWIQVAPSIALYFPFIYKQFFNKKIKIVADCHNSMFRPQWLKFPYVMRLLNKCDFILVHNDKVKEQAIKAGANIERLVRLETRPATLDCDSISSNVTNSQFKRPWVLLPCSFDADEPVECVIEAARDMPDFTIVITGSLKRAVGRNFSNLPKNVILAGFLDKAVFDVYLCQADIIMGLTTRDDIQLSVANEATGAGKPMVISDTPLLRSLFYKGAVFVDSLDPTSLINGCNIAISEKNTLIQEVLQLKVERIKRWEAQADYLKTNLH